MVNCKKCRSEDVQSEVRGDIIMIFCNVCGCVTVKNVEDE